MILFAAILPLLLIIYLFLRVLEVGLPSYAVYARTSEVIAMSESCRGDDHPYGPSGLVYKVENLPKSVRSVVKYARYRVHEVQVC